MFALVHVHWPGTKWSLSGFSSRLLALNLWPGLLLQCGQQFMHTLFIFCGIILFSLWQNYSKTANKSLHFSKFLRNNPCTMSHRTFLYHQPCQQLSISRCLTYCICINGCPDCHAMEKAKSNSHSLELHTLTKGGRQKGSSLLASNSSGSKATNLLGRWSLYAQLFQSFFLSFYRHCNL